MARGRSNFKQVFWLALPRPDAAFSGCPNDWLSPCVGLGAYSGGTARDSHPVSYAPFRPQRDGKTLEMSLLFTLSIAENAKTVNGGERTRRTFNLKISIPVDKMEPPCYNIFNFILRLQRPYVRNGNLPGMRVNKGRGTSSPREALASGITVAVRVEIAARWRKPVIGAT